MPDAQRIIEEIKHLLYSAGNPLPDEVLSVAGDYQDLCNVVNDRLRPCAALLRRGLRSEAIQQAEQEPNLLDLVATLDFAERPQWCDYLRHLGEMVPPDLLMDAATELNDAYAAEQPLLKLLRRHRKRALARAPLAERIEVLRAIAAADPLNNVWQEDLQTFEVARHRQIETEVNLAARSGDLPALATLESEVLAPDWRNPPNDALRTTTRRSHARLRQQRAREELAALEPELTAAHAAFDVETARRLRGRWQACAELAGLNSNELLVELAAPALTWLAEEDRREQARGEFDNAVYELEQKLDSGTSREDLVQAAHRAFRYEIDLPARLESRLRERLATIDAGNRRRFQLIIVGIVCGLLALGAATTAAIRHIMFVNAVAEAAGHVKEMLDEGKLDEAKEQLGGLSPDIAESEPVRVQAARFHDLQKTEDQRREQFDNELQTAEKAANFEPATPTLRSLANADQHLKDIDSKHLAKRPDEHTRISELRERIEGARVLEKTRLNRQFSARLDELIARLTKLEHDNLPPALALEALSQLRHDLSSLAEYSEGVSQELMANHRTVVDRVEALQKALASKLVQIQWQANITEAVGHGGEFAAMLREYEKKFPGSARTHDFGVSAAEMPLWAVLGTWDAGIQRLGKLHRPEDWVVEAQKLLNDPLVSKLPMIAMIQEKLPYFQAAAAHPPDSPPEAVKNLLGNPLISGLYTIDVRQDDKVKRFYVRTEPKYQADDRFTFKYVKNFQLEEQLFEMRKSQHLISKDDVVLQDGLVMHKAPQWDLADAIRKVFRPVSQSQWEANFFAALERVAEAPAVDPLVKALFLKSLVEAGKQGSLAFEEATRPLAALVNNVNGEVNWLLPDDAEANAQRSKAAGILQNLPSFADMRKTASERLAWMKQLPAGKHRWVGWLARAESGDKAAAGSNWRCLTKEPVAGGGKLIVLFQPKADGPIQVAIIGQAERGRLDITVNTGDALVEGRPVFLAEE